jgi:hypothetical protein
MFAFMSYTDHAVLQSHGTPTKTGHPDKHGTEKYNRHYKPNSPNISIELFFLFFFLRDRVSLCSPGCPGTHSVDQAGLELRNPPASAS